MAHGDAWEGKWRRNWRMEWVASTLHTTSEHVVSSITTADAHTSAASSRLKWRPHRFKRTRPFRRKTKSGSCACAITFQTQSTICFLYFYHFSPHYDSLWLKHVAFIKANTVFLIKNGSVDSNSIYWTTNFPEIPRRLFFPLCSLNILSAAQIIGYSRAGQLQPTGGPHNSLSTSLRAALVYT
jgi:hypothetical protein